MQFLDAWHILWILIYLFGSAGMCLWLKNKKPFFQKSIVYGIILLNFVLHFLAPWVIHDTTEGWLLRVTMVNVCAVLVFLSPFLYWQQDKFLKPAWIHMCIIGALGLLIFPEYAIGADPLSLNIIRLFTQHALLLFVPILMVVLGHETLRLRDSCSACIFYIIIIVIVIANDAILQVLGVVHDMRWFNGAFQWHPSGLYNIIDPLVPNIFMTTPFGPNAGEPLYWPIFYMLPAVILFILPLSLITTLILNKFKQIIK